MNIFTEDLLRSSRMVANCSKRDRLSIAQLYKAWRREYGAIRTRRMVRACTVLTGSEARKRLKQYAVSANPGPTWQR